MDSEGLLKYITEEYKDKIIDSGIVGGVATIEVKPGDWESIAEYLKGDMETRFLSVSNYGAVDYREKLGGYQLVITLFSYEFNHKLTMKTLLPAEGEECPEIKTLSAVWPVADWFERETAELFGIVFVGHPDPRHLMLDEDWDGEYPMRRGWSGRDFITKPDK